MKAIKGPGQVKSLALDQISGIIEACAKHNVTILKFGDLEISFAPKGGAESVIGGPTPPLAKNFASPTIPVAEMTDKQHEELTKAAVEQGEFELRELQIQELLITDPEKAEELMRQGELEDADNEPGDDQ